MINKKFLKESRVKMKNREKNSKPAPMTIEYLKRRASHAIAIDTVNSVFMSC